MFFTSGYDTCANRTSMDACLDRSQPPSWARTYAKAVAGKTTLFKFNTSTRVALLTYLLSDDGSGTATELFLSTRWNYPKGYSVVLSPAGLATWKNRDGDSDHVLIMQNPDAGAVELTVVITPIV